MMQGGAPRVVWLTLDTDPRAVSVISVAQRLKEQRRPCHLVWDPVTGDLVQMLPIVRAACALGTPENVFYEPPGGELAEGVSVNREGRLCVQIGVLGSATEPFTNCPMTRLGEILTWLDSWHIARRWPAGPPAQFRQAEQRPRSRAKWARGGHFGASQVPDTTSIGPGAIDIDQLAGAGAGAVTAPRPRREEPGPPTAILDRLGSHTLASSLTAASV
jgi:hypothetical protein